MPAPDRATPLLAQRDFALLWWGQLISILGERLTYLALVGLLAEHTRQFADPRSSWLLSLLANVMVAPVLLLAPFTGAWVDRSNLKHVMVVSDTLRAFIVAGVPAAYLALHHTLPVYVLVFLLFTCNVFFLPAKSAITPEIVAPGQLLAANALLAAAGIVSTAIGALAGGWMVDHWGWRTALWVNAGTYLWSVVMLALVRYRPDRHQATQPPITWRGYLAEVGEGVAVLRRSTRVGLGLTALGAVWIGGGFLHVAGNQHIQRAASVPGMERLGLLLAAFGVGSGLGTWWVNRHGRDLPRPALLGGGLLLVAAGLAVFAWARAFAVFALVSFAIGLAAAPAFMLSETLLQQGTELRQRARVFSLRDFLMRLLSLAGVTFAAWVTRSWGTQAALTVSAAVVGLTGALALAWGRRDPSLMRADPAEEPPSGAGSPAG
jgi:MFS family permease